jgi:hypothetical protein
MAYINTFPREVAESIFNFTKENRKFPNKDLSESVWGFGYTKDSPRQIFSVTKMYLSCQHVTTGKNIYFGFTVSPGKYPLQFRVKYWTQSGDERVGVEFIDTEEVARVEDVPAVLRNAARKTYEQALALHLERQGEARERREGAR